MKKIYIIISCYNEQENIPTLISELQNAFSDITISYEMVFVNLLCI